MIKKLFAPEYPFTPEYEHLLGQEIKYKYEKNIITQPHPSISTDSLLLASMQASKIAYYFGQTCTI